VKEGHDIARQVEESIKGQIENIYDIVVHIEPLHNEETEKYGVTPEEMSDFC
jgi:divalent metal cation (Fe/Co/Zn/Cd) transporter